MLNQKKGDAAQLFVIMAILFVFGIIFLIFSYLFITVSSALQGTVLNSTAGGAAGLNAMAFYGGTSLQYIFVFLFGALALGTIITSFSIRVHPVFLPINIVLLILSVIVAVALSNSFQMLNVGELAAVYAQNTMLTFIMENLVRFVIVLGVLDMIVLFVKMPGYGDSGGGTI
jgi:hypothetical protein